MALIAARLPSSSPVGVSAIHGATLDGMRAPDAPCRRRSREYAGEAGMPGDPMTAFRCD